MCPLGCKPLLWRVDEGRRNGGDKPAILAQSDYSHRCAGLIEGGGGASGSGLCCGMGPVVGWRRTRAEGLRAFFPFRIAQRLEIQAQDG
jgi:hypothetical protein